LPPPPRFSLGSSHPLLQWLLLLATAGSAGWLLKHLGFPAAHFLGPMLVAIAFGVSGTTIRLPGIAFKLGQGGVGLLVAHSLSAAVLVSLAQAWPVMLLATVLTVLLSVLVGLLLVRYCDLPGSTAAWGTSPGAASAMVAMAEEYGADSRIVATMQYVRVVCVVLMGTIVSHLLGVEGSGTAVHTAAIGLDGSSLLSFAGTLGVLVIGVALGSRLPAGALLCPLLLGAMLQLGGLVQISLPDWLLGLAYGAIGCYVGLRFDRATVRYVMGRLPALILSSLALIGMCALSALFIAWMLGKDFLSVYLATSPGGLDSMAIIAVDTHADVGLVLAMQTLRLFGVILTGPFLARQIIRMTQEPA